MYSYLCHNDRNHNTGRARLYTKCRNKTHALKSTSYTAGRAAAKRRTLNDISPGQHGVVTALLSSGDMRRRLLDIGLTPGTRVDCLGKSPLGDPAAFLIRGAVIALRQKDCRKILVDDDRNDCRNVLIDNGRDQNRQSDPSAVQAQVSMQNNRQEG